MKLLPLAAPLLLVVGASAARAEESDDPPAWSGSEISVKHSFSVASLMPGFEPDYNPVLVQSVSVDPVWQLSDQLRLTGHLGVETELTDSDVTSYERQPLLEDTYAAATYTLPDLLPAGIGAAASFRLTLPTSKESIARRRIAGFMPAVSVTRAFHPTEDVVVTPFATLRASYNWQLSTTLVYDGPSIRTCDATRADACEEFGHSGARLTVASFVQILGVNVELPHALRLTAQAWWIESWLYDLTPATGPDGEPVPTLADSTDWRLANVYLLAADWQMTDRWKVSGGFQAENPQQRPDGTYYLPFFNRFTQFFVTAAAVF